MQKILQNQENIELVLKGYLDCSNNILKQSYNVKSVNPSNYIEGEIMQKGIYKRTDGRYMIRKTVNGIRLNRYAKTLEEAKQIYKNLKKGKIKPKKSQKIVDITKTITLKEYSEEWLKLYKLPFLKPHSYSEVKSFVNRINEQIGKYKLKDLNNTIIQEYLNSLPRTRGKEKICIHLNAILQKAVDTDILNKNPFNGVIKDKKLKHKNNMYNIGKQEKIITAIKGTDIEHEIYLYLLCGCRPNELPQKENFDFENNIINVYGTKNDNALHREVDMSKNFSEYMSKYLQNNNILPEKYISKKFKTICESIGIDNPLLYRLRHTFASNHFILETQPKRVQEWMGHSSIKITLDTYTDIDKKATKEKIQKLYNNFYYVKE